MQHSPASRSQRKLQIDSPRKDHFESTAQRTSQRSHNTSKGLIQELSYLDDCHNQHHLAPCPGSYCDTSTPLHTRPSSFRTKIVPHLTDDGSDMSPQSTSPLLSSLPMPVISPVVGALDDDVHEKHSMRLLLSRFPDPPRPYAERPTGPTQQCQPRADFAPAAPWSLRSTSKSKDKDSCHISKPLCSSLFPGIFHSDLSSKSETESYCSQNASRLDTHAVSTPATEYSAPGSLASITFANKHSKCLARDSAMRNIEEEYSDSESHKLSLTKSGSKEGVIQKVVRWRYSIFPPEFMPQQQRLQALV